MTRRLHAFIVPAALTVAIALPGIAAAQGARAIGSVRDTAGKAIKGATIRAVNPDAIPSEVTSVSNNDGRWAMIGLKTGPGWTFIAEAPGFFTMKTEAVARVGNSPPLNFVLARDPGPVPGALTPNIEGQIEAATTLREQGRYDQAIAAFQEIRSRNPKLTHVNFVMAEMYASRAAQEADTSAKRALVDLAVAAYDEVLKADTANERARTARARLLASR